MRISNHALAAFVLVAGTAVGSDDLTIVSKHTQNGKPAGTTTSYLSSDHVRMAREEGHETIVDLKTGTMTTLDGTKKTYYTVTKQDMEDLKAKIQEKMNTPEMKKAMEAMAGMTSSMGSFDVKKTGVTRKIAGFSCEEWTVTMGALSTIRECVTSELQYPARAWDTYREFAQSMQSLMSAFGPMAKAGADLAEKLKVMKGFPVSTSTSIDVMGNKTTVETEVVEVRRGAIPASAWDIPAGYTKIENPMLKMFDRHGPPRH